MSRDSTIQFYTPQKLVPSIFTRVYHRIFDQYNTQPHIRLAVGWQSINMPPPDDINKNIHSLIESIIHSEKHISISQGYILESGTTIPITLTCYGDHPSNQRIVHDSGQITVRFDLSDIPWSINLRSTALVMQPIHECVNDTDYQLNDVEEFFFRVIRLKDSPDFDPDIPHAAFECDNLWQSPEGNVILYHRDWREFLRDLARSYACHHWGLGRADVLHLERAIWTLSADEQRALQVYDPPPRTWEWLNTEPDTRAHLAFLNTLDLETARRVTLLPETTGRALLQAALRAVPDVRCFDFGPQGMALATDPVTTIWRVYEYIARAVQRDQ